jgi:ABC-type transporter Mla subunit MlaD
MHAQVCRLMNATSTRREEALVGIFVLVAAAILIATVFSLTGFFRRGDVVYHAFFKNAGGLRPGAEVRYAGGPAVGRILKVQPDAHVATRMVFFTCAEVR